MGKDVWEYKMEFETIVLKFNPIEYAEIKKLAKDNGESIEDYVASLIRWKMASLKTYDASKKVVPK